MTEPVENEESTWSLITARGEDAYEFLQGQLSQDLAAAGGDGAWTLVLAPDSVVLSVGYVRASEDGVELVVPRALAGPTLARLRRFLLRSRCTLEENATNETPFASEADRVAASFPGTGEIERGLTPHSFGRSFVDRTVSFTKGCFTGQELVGRLDARGSSVPWRLVRFRATEVKEVDAFLRGTGPDGPQGVTSVVRDDDRYVGLGIAHRSLLGAEPPRGVTLDEVA